MKKLLKFLIVIVIILIIFILGIYFFDNPKKKNFNKDMFISSLEYNTDLYDLEFNKIDKITRGNIVAKIGDVNNNDIKYSKIEYDNKVYYILSDDLVEDKEKIIKEKELYVRTNLNLYENFDDIKLNGLIKKGNKVDIIGYDKLNSDGSVNMYKIKYGDLIGYGYSKYLVASKEESILHYDEDGLYKVHKARGDSWGGGDAASLDYYPYEKPKFDDNIMPKEVRSLYLNGYAISNVDPYINLAKKSGINAIVVDIKDGIASYPAKTLEKYSKTHFDTAYNSYEEYRNAIKKIKDSGLYVIGRITTFKDSSYAKEHPNNTILNAHTNKPYNHDGSYWPSGFSRDVWTFNLELAIESVKEMGFNEIQFDYVRFPDRVINLEKQGKINYNNIYKETKAQAIQNFVMYLCDELHKYNVYVSIDVFGESAHNYVTAYGQYWPAISNVADVISGMPYPDHFSKYEYGFKEPVWTIPYDLLYTWGNSFVMKRQKEIPTPAIARTWIQAYNAIREPYVICDEKMASDQIKGLYDAGLTGGFITWNGNSNFDKYSQISNAFGKEY